MQYFLAIIGGGPAGYTAAEKASKAGKDVVLFEQNAVGGTCLNVGCIPTKSLLYGAKQYYNATHAAKYGVTAENVSFDFTLTDTDMQAIAALNQQDTGFINFSDPQFVKYLIETYG